MNIGIIGWWRHDNQGDLTILANMTRALAPHRVVPIDLPFVLTEDALRRLNRLDFLILGGGGLLQRVPPSPFDTFDEWGKRLETPIGAAGIGVDELPDAYRRPVMALVEQARFCYVRDAASQDILGHAKVRVAPDLTFLYPLRPPADNGAHVPTRPICGVNLRSSPGLDAEAWLAMLKRLPVRLRGVPMSGLATWREPAMLRDLDGSCADAFRPDLFAGLDLMIGTAFHAVVFATQAAVPTIAIAYAPKVQRFMADVGLADYVVEPGEPQRVPELVAQVLDRRAQLSDHLRQSTAALSGEAQRVFADVRAAIEAGASSRAHSGPWVSAVVVGTGHEDADRTSLAACLDQTYPNVEIIYVGASLPIADTAPTSPSRRVKLVPGDPAESLGARLNRAFAGASGEYLTWTLGGSFYAGDAFDCMVDRLAREPECDMVYTDHYAVHKAELLADVFPVDVSGKLYRADVVGPSFLYRRRLAESVGPFDPVTPLPAYDYWLRAYTECRLHPMHVRLFYALIGNLHARGCDEERLVRRRWRASKPWAQQVFWRVVDSDAVERWGVQPLLALRRKASGRQ
jgi:hypothetical protein